MDFKPENLLFDGKQVTRRRSIGTTATSICRSSHTFVLRDDVDE